MRPQTKSINDISIPAVYLVLGILTILFYSVASAPCICFNCSDFPPPFFFYAGKWSLPNSLIYISVCFNTSGMRFMEAFTISLFHTVTCVSIPFLFYPHMGKMFTAEIMYLPLMLIMSMISAHDIEWQVRQGFLMKCALGESLQRQDELILSILPEEITKALKSNRIENLAKYYDNVTILFCYIVDFGKQSSTTYAQVLQLLANITTIYAAIITLTLFFCVIIAMINYRCHNYYKIIDVLLLNEDFTVVVMIVEAVMVMLYLLLLFQPLRCNYCCFCCCIYGYCY